jgi:protein-L-isoaspartate(D-aspartate) O-methyltransferase
VSWAKRFWPVLLIIVGIAAQGGALRAAPPDYAAERAEMVARLRQNRITSQHVLAAMQRVPRHLFCSPRDRERAYDELTIPVGGGQALYQPLVVARATQMLDLKPGRKVLAVGAGCGYRAAVLSEITNEVYAVDSRRDVLHLAKTRLHALGYSSVKWAVGKGCCGSSEDAPFDAILVTCAADAVPEALVKQLKDGGRMVIPVGSGPEQTLTCLVKSGGRLRSEVVMPVRVDLMVCQP